MKNLDPVATQQYIDKADHFFHAMRLLADDLQSYRTSIALLAVHSAISLNDAITVGLTGKRGKSQDHSAAATELEKLAKKSHLKALQGVQHLRWLLGQKSKISYQADHLDDAKILMAVDRAEKFNAWAYNYFKEILRVQAVT